MSSILNGVKNHSNLPPPKLTTSTPPSGYRGTTASNGTHKVASKTNVWRPGSKGPEPRAFTPPSSTSRDNANSLERAAASPAPGPVNFAALRAEEEYKVPRVKIEPVGDIKALLRLFNSNKDERRQVAFRGNTGSNNNTTVLTSRAAVPLSKTPVATIRAPATVPKILAPITPPITKK